MPTREGGAVCGKFEGVGFARLDRMCGGELQQVLDIFNDSLWSSRGAA